MPRDVDIGIATASPRSDTDYGQLGWLKKMTNYLSGLALGTAGTPSGGIQSIQGVEGGYPVTVTTPSARSVVSFTRTTDTTPYTAGDVIGINNAGAAGSAIHAFTSLGNTNGGEALITSVSLEIDIAAVNAGMTSFRLHLYDSPPASAYLDNAIWDLPAGDRTNYLGYIDLGAPVDVGSTLYVEANSVNKQISLLALGHVYGYIVTNGAYTPASGSVYKITLHAMTL